MNPPFTEQKISKNPDGKKSKVKLKRKTAWIDELDSMKFPNCDIEIVKITAEN